MLCNRQNFFKKPLKLTQNLVSSYIKSVAEKLVANHFFSKGVRMEFLDGEKFEAMAREYHKKYSNIAALELGRVDKEKVREAFSNVGKILFGFGFLWQKKYNALAPKFVKDRRLKTEHLESLAQELFLHSQDVAQMFGVELKKDFGNQDVKLKDCVLLATNTANELLELEKQSKDEKFLLIAQKLLTLLSAFYQGF